ncbi:N-acyl amino acid synthase FeeM domain-containing protein [Litoribrevibacter albus]|uniref:GNAT family N-acetyltransferase n=1 Tax=Litoribrevibacter albus TaxID=1473156 RepID=A0AA37W4J5_9GAMM|nr:GNAT family N-acyltransferase [Litoribrevibacter albus]GLQ30207.1 hypothetical protein GCM10007876_06850 [Litoribrevibacter albus]
MYGNFPKETDRKIYRPLLPENHGYQVSLIFADIEIQAQLNNFTSFGFSLKVPENYDELCFPGQVTILRFTPSISQTYHIRAQIIEMERIDEELRLSLRIISDGFIREPKFNAIELNCVHLLSGLMTHPFFYKTSSFFEVIEISREKLVVSGIQPDFTLFEDMEISFTLGMFQPTRPITGLISQVSLRLDGKVQCTIKLTRNLPKLLIDQLNKFLMQYTSSTPEQIRQAGFKVLSVKEFIHYRFAETQADYEAVLRTRRFAYSGVKKIDSEADLERVSYFFDDYSHILMVMHNEEIIGSATMIVGDGDNAPFEIQTFFDDDNPIELPPANKTIEVAALCLHPDYRDTDILHGIFEQIYMLTMMLNKEYIIASSDKYLLKLYQSIGFKLTPYSFVQPKYNDLQMSVLVIHQDAAQSAMGVKKMIWWPLWGVINKHLNDRRIIRFHPLQKIRSSLLKWGFKAAYYLKYRQPWRD